MALDDDDAEALADKLRIEGAPVDGGGDQRDLVVDRCLVRVHRRGHGRAEEPGAQAPEAAQRAKPAALRRYLVHYCLPVVHDPELRGGQRVPPAAGREGDRLVLDGSCTCGEHSHGLGGREATDTEPSHRRSTCKRRLRTCVGKPHENDEHGNAGRHENGSAHDNPAGGLTLAHTGAIDHHVGAQRTGDSIEGVVPEVDLRRPDTTGGRTATDGHVAIRCSGVVVWRWHALSGTRKTLLEGIDWEVRAGEHWALLGPNGAGKTTLLTLAGAADFPSSGTVEILGRTMGRTDVAQLRRGIGFVDARAGTRFAPMLSVREIVRTGATATIGYFEDRLTWSDINHADDLLGLFGLARLAERRFGDCSHGERTRALIARALVAKPQLLLLDEPGAGLDLPGRELLLTALARLVDADSTLAVVVTTHHLEELPASTTHALLLRESRAVGAGPVEETLTESRLSACFGIPIAVSRTGARWSATAAAT